MTMYEVWCEYDIGQERTVFSTKAKAEAWTRKAIEDQKDNGLEETYEELLAAGLVGTHGVEVDP